MNHEQITDGRIRHWLAEEASGRLPDGVYAAAIERIPADPRRQGPDAAASPQSFDRPTGRRPARRHLMLTLTRAAATIALVALGAGLAASRLAPATDPGGPPAALEASPSPADSSAGSLPSTVAWVTGTVPGAGCRSPDTTNMAPGDVTEQRGWTCGPSEMTTDDPRFGGTVRSALNDDVYHLNGRAPFSVTSWTITITNDGGRWVCHTHDQVAAGVGVNADAPSIGDDSSTCTGEGGYAGLTAIKVDDWSTDPVTITAFIFPGDVPPAPDPPPGG